MSRPVVPCRSVITLDSRIPASDFRTASTAPQEEKTSRTAPPVISRQYEYGVARPE